MSDRYFVESPIATDRAMLSGPDAHHFIHVMRAKPGVQVMLFDGSGCEYPAVVEQVGRTEVQLAVLSCIPMDRELPREVTLGVALPKGDRQKWLVEKVVELGVTRVVPLETSRGVAQPVTQALARLRRTVIEASKQCGRNRLMEIGEPRAWPEFVQAMRNVPCRWLAHPSVCSSLAPAAQALSDPIALAVGPEGGFTEEEVSQALAAGWQLVDLGPRILRVETAAIALAAIAGHNSSALPRP